MIVQVRNSKFSAVLLLTIMVITGNRDFNAPAIVSPGSDTLTDGFPLSSSSTAVCRDILAEIQDQIASIAENMRRTVSLKHALCARSCVCRKRSERKGILFRAET